MKWFLIRYVAICAACLMATVIFAILEEIDVIDPSEKLQKIMTFVAVTGGGMMVCGLLAFLAGALIWILINL